MRHLLALGVLGAGALGLGFWASQGPADRIEAEISASARAAAEGSRHPLDVQVEGRDITVSGFAHGEGEHYAILDAFKDVTGRRVVRDNLTVLPSQSPYRVQFIAEGDGLRAQGFMPTVTDVTEISAKIDAAQFALAAGDPQNFSMAAKLAADAAAGLESGSINILDQDVTVSGIVFDPTAQAALKAEMTGMPEGYFVSYDLELLDDGRPMQLMMSRADGQTKVAGKLPVNMDAATALSQLENLDAIYEPARIEAPQPDWPAVAETVISAASGLTEFEVNMIGDEVNFSGRGTREEVAKSEAILAGIPDGFTGNIDLDFWDDGRPFALIAEKTAERIVIVGNSKLPYGPDAFWQGLDPSQAEIRSDVQIAEIEDRTGAFSKHAALGLAALANLETGQLTVQDGAIALSGVARTPAEGAAAAAMIDSGSWDVTQEFEFLDDGTPPRFRIESGPEGAHLSGKLPPDLTAADIAARLGIGSLTSTAVTGLIPAKTAAEGALDNLAPWLPELSNFTLDIDGDEAKLDVAPAPGIDPDLLAMGLSQDFDGQITLVDNMPLPADGTERLNPRTGRAEILVNQIAWVPVFDFDPVLGNCQGASQQVLARDRVNFLSGSAQLDAKSLRAVNALAGVMRHCADPAREVEIAGHTDATGNAAANLALSQARAEAVRDALVARGVDAAGLVAVGYGQTQPIADDATAEGQATNRRTEITWRLAAAETATPETITDTEEGE